MPGAPSVVVVPWFVALLVAASAPDGAAQAKPPKGPPLDKLEQQEAAARGKASGELLALAKFAESLHAAPEARAACAAAYVFAPRDDKARDELAKVAKLKGERPKDAAAKFAEQRTKTFAKCVELLTPVFQAYADADCSDELARLMSTLQDLEMPVEPLVKKHEFVWYAPCSDWRRKKDVDRFAAGTLVLDGVWYDAKKVAELDAAHADWAHPWRFGEEVHEVKTTLPLATARRILATVVAYRTFVLCYLGVDADLRPPTVKLPLVLTATRKEMEARAAESPGRGTVPKTMAAFYEGGSLPGGACFVSFEMNTADGQVLKVDFDGLREGLLHEVTHQILYEYNRYALGNHPPQPTADLNWVAEGVAEFLPCFEPVDGKWTLRYTSGVKQGDRRIEGGFWWCQEHADQMVPLAQFTTWAQSQMGSVDAYHQACALANYLLEAKDRDFRARFCRLVVQEHQFKAGAGSFAAAFPGVDVAALDADFKAWCKALVFEKHGAK